MYKDNPMNSYRQTPLHDWHVDQHANMAIFGGYHMPVWYPTGAKQEHLSVILSAGMFDTSHMAAVMVYGYNAFDLIQKCFSRDIDEHTGKALNVGRCIYGVFLNPNGEVIDDAIVYRIASDMFMIIVNAGMGTIITNHLSSHATGLKVTIIDLTDQVGKIDLQGPLSGHILYRIIKNPDQLFDSMPYFSFKGYFDPTFANSAIPTILLTNDIPILVSRSGYTGEFGFELFINPNDLHQLWELILDSGKSFQIIPCGLAARDSLRVGALLPLSHQDIGAWKFINNPWTFALPYRSDRSGFTKKFIGSEALISNDSNQFYTYPFIGFDLRKVSSENSQVLLPTGEVIGSVLSCVSEMAIGFHDGTVYSIASPNKPAGFQPSGLSCGFIRVDRQLSIGTTIHLKDLRRNIPAKIVSDIRPHRTARCSLNQMI